MANNYLEKDYLLTCSLRETSIQANVATIRNAIFDGADAFMLHLEKIPDENINVEDLKRLYDYAGKRPIISVNYRSKNKPGKTDDDLIAQQMISIEAGAQIVDVFGDIYNPSKDELALDSETINKQKDYINTIHSRGAKVLMSSHIYRYMNTEEVLSHALKMQERGADIAKIAMTVNSEVEFQEAINTMFELKNKLSISYFFVTMGQYGKLLRQISGLLGSKIVLCNQQYTENSKPLEQPLLRAMKTVYDNLDLDMARDTTLGTVKGQ